MNNFIEWYVNINKHLPTWFPVRFYRNGGYYFNILSIKLMRIAHSSICFYLYIFEFCIEIKIIQYRKE
jgi:hypothetical protein